MADNSFKIVGAKTAQLEKIEKPSLSFTQDAWRRLKQNKTAIVSMFFLIIIGIVALIGTVTVSQNSANQFNTNEIAKYKNLPPKSGLPIPGFDGKNSEGVDVYAEQGVSDKQFLFGTDSTGRSLGKRLLVGLRISLTIALVASFIDLVLGVAIGLFSSWRGGVVDLAIQRFIEFISSVPTIVIVTLLVLAFGASIWSVIFALVFVGWIPMSRQVRASALSLKNQDYVLAAQTLGESGWKINTKHILPNISSTIIVQLMSTIPAAIESEAVLSALGLGVQPPTASLGSLINDASKQLQYNPYQLAFPAFLLVVISLAFYLFGDGLRDAFDPRSSED